MVGSFLGPAVYDARPCMLLAFYIGGFIIGLVSLGLRILEPALGAFLSVATMMTITLFTPLFERRTPHFALH